MPDKPLQGKFSQVRQLPGDSLMTLEQLYAVVKRRRKGIMVAIACSFVMAFGYHFFRTPEYHAVSIIMINDQNKDQGDLFGKVVGPEPGMGAEYKSIKKDAEILKSMAFAEITVKEMMKSDRGRSIELFDRREYDSPLTMMIKPFLPLIAGDDRKMARYSNEDVRRFADRLNKRIRIEPVRETNIIKISIASPFPDEAEYLSNTACRVYRDLAITQNSAKYAQAYRFISAMLRQQGEKLADADAALSRHMAVNEIYESTGNTGELLKRLVGVDAQYNDMKAEYNIAKNNLEFLDAKLTETDKDLSSRISQNVTAQLGSIIDEVRRNESDYVRIVRDNGIDSPEAKTKKQQLDLVKTRYHQLSRSKIAGQIGYIGRTQKYSFDMVSEKLQIERTLNDLSFSTREFGRLKNHYEAQLSSLPAKQQEYIRLQRDREAISKTYVFLKEKLDESRILIGSEVGSVSIVGDAFKPIKPESPDMKQTLLLGLVFGGLFAGVYAYGAESLDNKVRDESFFRNHRFGRTFMIPEFGRERRDGGVQSLIPEIPRFFQMGSVAGQRAGEGHTSRRIMMTDHLMSSFSESMRILGAHLDHMSADRHLQVIQVSGTAIGEGKSTICANLAMVYAMSGRKTLVVDGDVFHATQHTLFECNREAGLSDYLLSREEAFGQGLIQQAHVDNLFVLSAGKQVTNPGELTGSGKMGLLLAGLKERFDIILIDSPPLYLSDSIQLSHYADGILAVARLGCTDKKLFGDLVSDGFFRPKILGVAISGHSVSDRYDYLRYHAVS